MPEFRAMDWLERALSDLPRDAFKARLKRELERTADMTLVSEPGTRVRQTAAPQLRIRNAPAAIDFYTRAFGAREVMRFEARGRVAHAELLFGPSLVIIAEEAPEYGFLSPEALGGSPVAIRLVVDDADEAATRAVAAGARLVSPVENQFYGDRSGRVVDPFGYTWTLTTRVEEVSLDEMHRRLAVLEPAGPQAEEAAGYRPEGFRTVTPYIVVHDVPALIDFTMRTFGAREIFRSTAPAGDLHTEVKIGDSIVMIGGGAPDLSWRGRPMPSVFHVYLPDVDAVVERALQAGATLVEAPADRPYGERLGSVADPFGNTWYVATSRGPHAVPEGRHALATYLHPRRADPVIAFMKRAFGAEEVEKHASIEGVVYHAVVRIGDSTIEMGEAYGSTEPMPTMFYLYLPNVDASYQRAIDAGGTSILAPADQPYGVRMGGVKDPFGNQWYLARQIAPRR